MSGYRCPRCRKDLQEASSGARCDVCGGVWISESVLAELTHAPAFTPRADSEQLPCPACGAELAAVQLEGMPVDRCTAQHGVWFDVTELEKALQGAAEREDASSVGFFRAIREKGF